MKVSFSNGERRFLKPNLYNFVIVEVTHNTKGKFSDGWDLKVACMDTKPVFDEKGVLIPGADSFDMKIKTTLWYKGKGDETVFSTKVENGLKAICLGSGIPFTDDGEMGIDSFEELQGCIFKAMVNKEQAKKDGQWYNNINPESIIEADDDTVALAQEYEAKVDAVANEKKEGLTTKNFTQEKASAITSSTTRKPLGRTVTKAEETVADATTDEQAEVTSSTAPAKRDRRAIFGKK